MLQLRFTRRYAVDVCYAKRVFKYALLVLTKLDLKQANISFAVL